MNRSIKIADIKNIEWEVTHLVKAAQIMGVCQEEMKDIIRKTGGQVHLDRRRWKSFGKMPLMLKFILDSTVLSNFAAAGIVELLADPYKQKAYTTGEVLNELKRGVERGYSYLESAVEAVEGPMC